MTETKETVTANILNRAFNSSYTGGDGKELCATDHATAASSLEQLRISATRPTIAARRST